MERISIDKGLFLDDTRTPESSYWIVCRDPLEFIKYAQMYIFETYSFDHDINCFLNSEYTSTEITGYDTLVIASAYIPKDAAINFHTSNPVGKAKMEAFWKQYSES